MKTLSGFTLVELLVTLAVFGILALAAMPAFNGYVTSNRMITDTNSFVGTLNYARTEAIKRRVDISVCRSSDGATCATAAGAWNTGWIVFVNTDNDMPAQVDVGEEILRVSGSLNDSVQASLALADYITFNSNGYSSAQGQFIVCDKNATTSTARAIALNRIGRITLSTGGGTCTPA